MSEGLNTERSVALETRLSEFADLCCETPLNGAMGDVAYNLLRQAAAQIASDRQRLASCPAKTSMHGCPNGPRGSSLPERDAAIARAEKAEREHDEELRADNERLLPALVGAYHNAEQQLLSSEDLVWGHKAGVRDVAVRLRVYDEFCAALNKEGEHS